MAPPTQTHCQRGHEFTEANSVWARDGRRRCKTCRYETHNRWVTETGYKPPPKPPKPKIVWDGSCSKCGMKYVPFPKKGRICKACGSAHARERYRANPQYRENRREYERTYRGTHQARKRMRKLGSKAKARLVDRPRIFERDRGICHICRKPVDPNDWHLDHLIPLSRGGEHVSQNVAVAHPFCNMSRSAGRIPAQLRLTG